MSQFSLLPKSILIHYFKKEGRRPRSKLKRNRKRRVRTIMRLSAGSVGLGGENSRLSFPLLFVLHQLSLTFLCSRFNHSAQISESRRRSRKGEDEQMLLSTRLSWTALTFSIFQHRTLCQTCRRLVFKNLQMNLTSLNRRE